MKKQKLLRWAIKQRKVIQVIIGVALYIMIGYYHISLWYVLLFGAITGVILGKVFCRWMCPMGVMMEFLMSMTPGESFRQTYQYHKLGCPIAWISGWLNRFSFYRISLNKDTCKSCGICAMLYFNAEIGEIQHLPKWERASRSQLQLLEMFAMRFGVPQRKFNIQICLFSVENGKTGEHEKEVKTVRDRLIV
ncbi:4Fe-4S binding protein [Prolixibacter sp. NT017]|uniref:4Fe-4S binding protein n=1 Tax=Prolixibacter sp. NT017 TaxID=2652390 RepID=UPI001298FC6A|nr:4Fe-4S binding protein [Prolixibacter sp. NT017]